MKNKIILFIFFSYFFSYNFSYSKIIKFESPELKILDNGAKITANNGVKAESDDGILINADQGIYNKKDNILKFFGNIIIKDNIDNILINADEGIYNKKDNILKFFGNIIIKDNIQNLKSTSDEITYSKNTNTINIIGESKTSIKDKYTINSENLVYDRNKMEIFSEGMIELEDVLGNKIKGKNLKFKINENIVKGKDFKIYDNQNNQYFLKNGIVNLNSNQFVGKDIEINFKKSLFGNEKNDPRLKGKSLTANNDQTNIYKGVFTTCKKKGGDSCPAWAIYADEVEHLKKKKIINYKNAWLKIYDVPVVYFPKFYHPDPTVERQSGFLFPTFNNSNLHGQSVQIPYFKVISDNKDLTISPRLYYDNNILIQSEYRQANKNSNFISDFSINKNITTKAHFFSNFIKNLNNNSKIELNVEKVSNDHYLKLNDIKSPLIKNKSKLYSYLNYTKDGDDYRFNSSIGVYEDLSKNKSDRYEYIYPKYNFYKEVDETKSSKGNFIITSDGYQKTYDTNSSESVVINDFLFDSYMQSFKNGITNNYKFLLRNVNSNASQSTNYKNEEDVKLLSTFLLETKYPLLKKTEKYDNFFVPTLSFKYSPNKTKNSKNEKSRLNFNNIFNIDRSSQNDLVESGQSFTLGFEYEKINKKNSSTFLNLGLAAVFRDRKDFDLPEQSSLGEKTSDVVGIFNLKPSKYFDFKYKFSIDNNLDQINYNNINTKININNLITSFEFLEENKHIGDNSYLINKTTYNFNENKLIRFETSKDLKKDLTEYYKLIYEYKNDCLTASIEYDKEYYSDGDLKPKENIFLMFIIKPFGQLANLPVSKSK